MNEQRQIIKLIATTYYKDRPDGFGKLVKIINSKGESKEIQLQVEDYCSTAALKKCLLKHGMADSSSGSYWPEIFSIVQANSKRSIEIVNMPGFCANGYMLASGTHLPKSKKRLAILSRHTPVHLPEAESGGTYEDWHAFVNRVLPHSNLLVLAVCAAFGGVIAKLAGVESGGFHFYGKSSIGKSTCLRLACSIAYSKDGVLPWRTTMPGFDELCAGRNDSFMCFDEISLIDSRENVAAQKASEACMSVTSGKGKLKTTRYASKHEQSAISWSLTLLSSGNPSLSQHAMVGGKTRHEAEMARVVDQPADAGQKLGIFESIPSGFDGPRDVCAYINAQTEAHYAHALPKYVTFVLSKMREDEEAFCSKLKEHLSLFRQNIKTSKASLATERRLDKYGLAFAAGRVAIDSGLLDLSSAQLGKAIAACWRSANESAKTPMEKAVCAGKAELLSFIKANRASALHTSTLDKASKGTIDAAKLFSGTVTGKSVWIIPKEVFHDLFPDANVRRPLLKALKRESKLLVDADGKSTRPTAFSRLGKSKTRMYHLIRSPKVVTKKA